MRPVYFLLSNEGSNVNKQAIELVKMLLDLESAEQRESASQGGYDNGMVGKYVIVRCRDAGVHAGVLQSHHNRECVLTESRRLWYWKPANGAAFLSGVAMDGLDDSSKVGKPQTRIHLTETCEIAECTGIAERSIRSEESYNE